VECRIGRANCHTIGCTAPLDIAWRNRWSVIKGAQLERRTLCLRPLRHVTFPLERHSIRWQGLRALKGFHPQTRYTHVGVITRGIPNLYKRQYPNTHARFSHRMRMWNYSVCLLYIYSTCNVILCQVENFSGKIDETLKLRIHRRCNGFRFWHRKQSRLQEMFDLHANLRPLWHSSHQ